MRSTRSALLLALAGASIAFFLAQPLCGQPDSAQPDSTQEDGSGLPPVMRIDGEPVSADEFGRWLVAMLAARTAKSFAEGWVVEREADRRGVAPEESEIRARMEAEIGERVEGAFLGRREDWIAELERTGRSEAGYRLQRATEVRPELAATALTRLERVVPEDKVVRDWELFYGPQGRSYELLAMSFPVVVVTPPAETPRERAEEARRRAFREQEDRARAARDRILAGEDFVRVAQGSGAECANAACTLQVGARFRDAGWPDVFLDELARLAPGAPSQPVYARGGYRVVQLVSCVDTPLESVRDELEQRLIARGPEQDEIGRTWIALTQGLRFELQPGLFEPQRASSDNEPEPTAIVIEGTPVPRGVFARWLLAVRGEPMASTFAEHWLVQRKARSLGIEATEDEVERRVRSYVERLVASGYKGSRERWLAYLALGGRNEAGFLRELRVRMRTDLLCERMILRERQVTGDDVRRRWLELFGEGGRWIEARVIAVEVRLPALEQGLAREAVDALVEQAEEDARTKAEELVLRLHEGEDFAALARSHSDDEDTRKRGGALSGRFRPDAWPSEVASALEALEPGEIAGPLRHGPRWWIFEVTRVKLVSFDEARAEIEAELRERPPAAGDLAGYRNSLLKEARVEVLTAMFR